MMGRGEQAKTAVCVHGEKEKGRQTRLRNQREMENAVGIVVAETKCMHGAMLFFSAC